MPTRPLPHRPDFDQLRTQAGELYRAARAGEPAAVALVRELHPRLVDAGPTALAELSLADAQLVLARSYRFASWPALADHVDLVTLHSRSPHAVAAEPATDDADRLLRLALLTYGSDAPGRLDQATALLADRPELGRASIYTAAATGDTDAVQDALAADPGAARRAGGPFDLEPLLYLTYSRLDGLRGSAPAIARLLLDAGADPGAGFLWEGLPSPFTALTGAFGGGEQQQSPHPAGRPLAVLLLEAGADANDSQTLYNLHLDHVGDDPSHLELLYAHGLGRGDGGAWHRRLGDAHPSPAQLVEDELLVAAEHGWRRRAALVLDHGVDVTGLGTRHPVHRGLTAWELAVRGGHTEVVELLAEAGARPAEGDPVLELLGALAAGDRATARALAAHVDDARSQVPDHLVDTATRGRLDAVNLLVELGWDVNARAVTQAHHQTALHGAAYAGHLDVVQALVAHGADPTIEDTSFQATPQGWAEHGGHAQVAAYLAELPPG